jgi:hypothetical protein
MGRLDDKPMPSLREAQAAVQEKRQKEIAASERQSLPGDLSERESNSARVGRGTARLIGAAFEFVANGFEALFGRSMSREESTLVAVKQHELDIAAKQAKRDRGDDDRGR